jgi:hypothetical protein
MVLGTTAEKIRFVHRKSTGCPDFLCSHLDGGNVPRLSGLGWNDSLNRERGCRRGCDACMGLLGRDAVCSMELGLFARNFEASSHGSSAIARRQFPSLTTGNTLNPFVRLIRDSSLHYWTNVMHVDGFGFDLVSVLSRDESG